MEESDCFAPSRHVNGDMLNGEEALVTPPCEVNGLVNNNHLANGLDGVRLRNTGSKHLSNGHLSPRRELSPVSRNSSKDQHQRDLSPLRRRQPGELSPQQPAVLPKALYDKLKTLTSMAKTAEDQIRELQTTLKDALRDGRPALVPEASPSPPASWGGKQQRSPGGGRPRDKEFVVRNSTLTDLFAVSHIRTIYHVAVVVLIILVLKTAIHDLATHGTVTLSVGLIWYAFGSFHRVISIWLVMMLAAIVQYAAFTHWAQRRPQLATVARRCWDGAHLVALVAFDVALLWLPVLRVVHYSMPFASSMTVVTEAVRILMKTHAFVRSNVPRALKEGTSPGFSQYLYFMFAPTLIYRDSYPRTPTIRWRVVVCHVLEVVGCIFYLSFLHERYLLPLFEGFGLRPGFSTPLEAASALLAAVLPAGLAFVCCFYLQLHSWQNAWAEMLRFGDRMFYMDWWNQTNYSTYYRTWNVLVQDWLHTYVYKDVILLGGSGLVAKLAVFCISAIVHEFIMGFTMGFFYPVLYLFFGVIGMLLSFVTYQAPSSSVGNIGLWFSLLLGSGILFGSYSMECYARLNCARTIDSAWDLVVPRSWNCVPINSLKP